jgi:hypothetical protein
MVRSIRRLESSKHIKDELSQLEHRLLQQKKKFNALRHSALQKERLLLELNLQLSRDSPASLDGHAATLCERETRIEELKEAMESAVFEREILEHMLHTRKLNLLARVQPTTKMRRRLLKLQSGIVSAENDLLLASSQILQLNSSMQATVKSKEDLKEIKTKQIEGDLQKYEDRQKFACYLAQEHDKNLQLDVLRRSVEERIELKKQLERRRENATLTKEVAEMDEFNRRQELQFMKIQKMTSVSSVSDLVPYYEYLKANEAKLADSVTSALKRIESLSDVRNDLAARLQRIKYSSDGSVMQFSAADVEAIELRLKQRSKTLDDDEKHFSKLEEVVTAACNCVSRVAPQVSASLETIDVNPETLTEHLALCGMKLEQMYNSMLRRDVIYLGESINTVSSKQQNSISNPPQFMKLGQQPRKTSVDELPPQSRRMTVDEALV